MARADSFITSLYSRVLSAYLWRDLSAKNLIIPEAGNVFKGLKCSIPL